MTPASPALTDAQSLTLLLTTESLLFAAFALAVGLVTPVAGGRALTPRGAWVVALFVALTLFLVAGGAGLAWWQVFVDQWPDSTMRQLQAVALAGGIAIQPLIAAVVTYASRR